MKGRPKCGGAPPGGGSRPGPRVLGVVGGIGSGKSTVAGLLEARGARRIDADRLARQALREPGIRAAIRRRFGPGVFTGRGAVDREALGARVFRDPAALRALNRILHPRIRSEIRRELERLRRGSTRVVVLDVPLLLESGLDALCDRILYVRVPRATRARRLKAKRGWSLAELRRRESFQIPLNEKRRRADDTIDNSQSIRTTSRQIEAILAVIAGSDASGR